MTPRILIVEDNRNQAQDIVRYLSRIEGRHRSLLAIDDFEITQAYWADQARDLIDKAATDRVPYDVMFLDLSLPKSRDSKHEHIGEGLELLDTARKQRAVRDTIAVSAFSEPKWVSKALGGGVVDFIAKPYQADLLRNRFLATWDRILSRESSSALDQRVRRLVPHSERGLTFHLGACFSRCVQAVLNGKENLQADVVERLALDPERDAEDALLTGLAAIQGALERARKEWTDLSHALGNGGASPCEIPLERLLAEVLDDLGFLLARKNARLRPLPPAPYTVLSFQDDVRAVISELVAGALSELPDAFETETQFEFGIAVRDQAIELAISAPLPFLHREALESINQGFAVPPDARFGRAWGLSVVQHTALRGGGRLVVDTSSQGNMVRYLVPRALHAQGPDRR